MENRGNYLGKDGKYYKTTAEWTRANAVVEEQQKQTRVLEQQAREQQRQNAESQRIARQMAEATKQQNEEIRKQNEIAMLQAVQEQMKMKQEKQLEYDRQEHERNLEQARHEHEKELLLLKIFDEVSIPLGLYQKFEEKLLNAGRLSQEDADRYTELMTTANTLIEKRNEDTKMFGEVIKDNLENINDGVEYTEKYKNFEGFVNGEISITDFEDEDLTIIDNQDIKEVFNKTKKEVENAKTTLKVLTPLYYLMGIATLVLYFKYCMEIGAHIALIFPIGLIGVALFCTYTNMYETSRTGNLKVQINQVINEQMINELAEGNSTEEEKAVQDEMQKLLNKLQESNKEIVDKRLEDLYTFRINHYNMRMEKIFYDVGLINKCTENNYKWRDISKSEVISEGTYEDYFHYFNNYNPDNEEQ